jgi:hypothetical protein
LGAERVSFLFASIFPLMAVVRLAQRITRPVRQVSDTSDITVPVAAVNQTLGAFVRVEAAIAQFVPMPFGSSILVVARRPSA